MAEFNQKIICLLTDFGLKGQHYVASMKGVILKINPNVRIVDITHNITPFSIIEASYILKTTYMHFPEGTIFIIVVDPGVGSSREILAIKTKSQHYFVGPNNGIFSGKIATDIEECIEVQNDDFFKKPISSTFHGRDIMAPVAAHLISGVPLIKIGSQFNQNLIKKIPLKYNINTKNRIIQCVVQYIDAFGNVTTNIPIAKKKIQNSEISLNEGNGIVVKIGKKNYKGHFTLNFSSVPVGSILFLIGSTGFLEISINQGDASKELGLNVGDKLTIRL
ncbi:MAG: S-adenosyl-l-methionine hydroxide adenosyltransferase family protein [Candidatus Thorarchaeota archaeon]